MTIPDFEAKYRYGFFVHYIAPLALYRDGTAPSSFDEAANRFDVPGFVRDIVRMKVDYLIFTAWHFRMIPLYPSAVTEKIRPGCSVKRDLLGEIIDGVHRAGIGVILYTHPRDGHDFVGKERTDCGWGEGWYRTEKEEDLSRPDPKTFDYPAWNAYVQALYKELIARYGDRIDGIFTDGMGPCILKSNWPDYTRPVVDYLEIRRTVRSDPRRILIQNYFGCEFSDDYIMPEGFFGLERKLPVRRWPACEKAIATSPFSGWAASGRYGEDVRLLSPGDIALYTVFQSTCVRAGGVCWASGPYCGGGWDVGVMETMQEVGRHMERLRPAIRDTVPSTSWPTVSGDTIESRHGVFAASSSDRTREFVHVADIPEDGIVILPAPEDGAGFRNPRAVTGGVTVSSFEQDGTSVRVTLRGTPDEVDTVIVFDRVNDPAAPRWKWIDCADKRLRYLPVEDWTYRAVGGYGEGEDRNIGTLGAYEYDTRTAERETARMDTWIEGSEVEIYGSADPAGGEADLVIDDMFVARLSSRGAVRKNRVLLGSSGELAGGIHTVTLVARGRGFEFDAMRIRL